MWVGHDKTGAPLSLPSSHLSLSLPTSLSPSHPLTKQPQQERLVFSQPSATSHDSDKLPLWKKLTFAVGAMPYAMCNTVLGFYFGIFLLEVAIVSGSCVYISGISYTPLTHMYTLFFNFSLSLSPSLPPSLLSLTLSVFLH